MNSDDAACTTSDPTKMVDFKDYKGALYDPEKRWPFAQACAEKFIGLANSPATRGAVDSALESIAGAGRAP